MLEKTYAVDQWSAMRTVRDIWNAIPFYIISNCWRKTALQCNDCNVTVTLVATAFDEIYNVGKAILEELNDNVQYITPSEMFRHFKVENITYPEVEQDCIEACKENSPAENAMKKILHRLDGEADGECRG